MKTNAPKQPTWLIALILGVIGIAGRVVPIPAVAPHAFWLVAVAFIILALACVVKDL